MLQYLQIENYALIRSLRIDFDAGFTVITGETGAGKSIIIGALSMLLGKRADTTVLYDKNRKCFVEGVFDAGGLHLQEFFEANDLDYDESITIRREVNEKGKSRAFINDTPVTLNVLKELAEKLVDIHSQHNNLLVNNEDFQISLLDQFAHNTALLNQYKTSYNAYKKAAQSLQQLEEQQRQHEQERSYLEYVFQELENAKLIAGEQENLEQQISLLSNAESIKSKLYESNLILAEAEEHNIIQQLQIAKDNCLYFNNIDSEMTEIAQRIESCLIEIKDISEDISRKENNIEVNPQELSRCEERLDLLMNLQHKHHANNNEELLEIFADTDSKLQAMSDEGETVEKQRKLCIDAFNQMMDIAQELSRKRQQAVAAFKAEMISKIRLLGMEHGNFDIEVSRMENAGINGIDRVCFLFSANKGSEMNEIGKTASGGEISRLMLAIKSVINDSSLLPTVVFDEIDTGISGEVASKVATMMREISKKHQLLVITHLPQIAAQGNKHYFVYKEFSEDKTHTQIRSLNADESIQEIAGMISGDHISEAALNTAKELKNNILL